MEQESQDRQRYIRILSCDPPSRHSRKSSASARDARKHCESVQDSEGIDHSLKIPDLEHAGDPDRRELVVPLVHDEVAPRSPSTSCLSGLVLE